MYKLTLFAGAALVLTVLPASARAQVAVEANGAYAEDIWGGELGVAYNLGIGGFTLRPGGGLFIYAGDNDRYFISDLGNGQSRCRDSTNGQFAADEKCDNTAVKAYARLEATYTIPGGPELGVGGRYSGDDIRPYGTVSFAIAPRIRLKGNVGDDYYAAGMRIDF